MKRIIVWITVLTLVLAGVFAMNACNKTDQNGVDYQLNLDNFSETVAYGEEIDLSRITITRTENGVSTVVPVDQSMVTTPVDVSKAGAQLLKLNYSGQTFHVPVIVKYRVEYLVDDLALKTFYVLNASELEAVEAPEKDGYVFSGWSSENPDIITDNITLSAIYTPFIPELPEVNATYGDKLTGIQLPYTVVGSWQFDSLEGTVGNAGKQTFDVSFVTYATSETIQKATLTVNVAKKEVVFSDLVTSFTYNGEEQKPTFKTDVPVDVEFYASGNGNYIDAGTYEYYFEVNDPNYAGELTGTFTILPAKVTVKINSYTVFFNEAFPKVEYSVEGFDQAKLDLLDLVITDPEAIATGVGTYTLTATTLNPNIELVVEPGTLTVNSSMLDVAAPVLLAYSVCYGETLDKIEFQSHPNGKWSWKTPTDFVGNKGQQKHIAVFTPYDSRYETIECEVTIVVEAKQLILEVTNGTLVGNLLTFVYNGQDQALTYVIKDAEGNIYDLAVLGNDPFKNANKEDETYSRTLTLADPNYAADWSGAIVVKKATPETDFSKVFTANWATTPRLSHFELPAGYQWVDDETTRLPGAGEHLIQAVFVPADADNYETIYGTFKIVIAKATASIGNVAANYNSVYNGNAFAFSGVEYSYQGAVPAFIYKNNATGEEFEGLPTKAGTYTVTIMLPESANYLAAEPVTTTVTIAKVENTDSVIVNQSKGADDTLITYGDAATKIQLPTSALGQWTLEGNPTTVGNAGINTFVAIFTPTDAENYNGRSVEIAVTVAKKSVTAPTISVTNKTQVYTGKALYSGLVSAEGYIITDNGGVNVGSYTVTLALASDNYIWSDGTSADKSASYEIVVATNQWTTDPTIGSWIYGEAGDNGLAEAMVGQIIIEYKLADADDSAYSTTRPTNAGAYVARFTAIDPNYATITATRNFTISKKEISAPEISADKLAQIYTGSALYSGLNSTDDYTVTDNGGTNVGTYTVLVALKDKANHKWAGSDSNDISLTYTVAKAQVVISDFAINGWTYGENANAPVANVNFGTITYVYATAVGGEYTASVPTDAGTYYVKAVVATTENLIGTTSEAISFIINKASTTINGASDNYSKVYDTKEFNITGVTVSNGAALTVVITKDGETVDKMLDAGEYTVTFSYAGDNNYLAVTKTVTVTVEKATNTEAVNTNQSATYGDLASVIVLPEGIEGYWTIEGNPETVGNAGTNTFKAIFTSTTGNYNDREEIIAVTVAKITVKVPIVENYEFDEQYHNSGLTDTDEYTVTEDIGGIDHGDYQVILTLNDPANYKWATTEEATITIPYVISVAINKWVDAPTIADAWEYESAGDTGYASALHGGVLIEYKLEGADDSAYSTALPTIPGKYVARFTTTDDNYTILQVVEHFEITKRKIDVPTQSATEFVYTGNTIVSGIVGNEFYTVVDAGAINVQAGLVATATLTSEYYVWADGVEDLARTFTYSIVKADIVISDPVIEGWTYGEDANAPTSTNNFDQVVSYVYASAVNGEYTATVPTNAGTYYVKAIAQGDENLNGAESAPVSFTIAKAQASIIGAENNYTALYTNSAYTITGVTASNGVALEYAYTKNGEAVSQIWNAGVYTVTITLPESANYLGDSVEVTVTITKVENTDTIPTYTATYGDKLSTLNVPVSTTGTWTWSDITEDTTVGNAGVQTHTLVFTPADAENYETRTVEVSVTVYKKVVTTPVVPNASVGYNGQVQYTGLNGGAIYTTDNDGHTNVGDYTVTLTLADPANYAWNSLDNETTTVEVVYSITKVNNAITDISYTESWAYLDEIADFSATALYGDVLIEYTSDDVTYTTTRPTVAGIYKVRFTTTDTNCDPVVEVRSFTIGRATVPTPSVAAGETPYNGNVITSGIVSNELYTVVDAGGTDVGTYTVVLQLIDKVNCKWSTTQDSADIELTYKVTKATTTIEILSAGWAYGAFQAPVVSVTPANLSSQVVITYSTDGGATWSTTPPVEVGIDYLVKAEVAGGNNYTSASAQTDFDIGRATPVLSAPTFAGGTFYKNQFTPTVDGMTASYNGTTLNGTFAIGSIVFADGANASYVTITFTPEDTHYYTTATVNCYLTFVSVAYLNNSTAYGSIEDALKVAGSGDVIWVRPNTAGIGPIYIMSDVTVPKGVTLVLPHGADGAGRNSFGSDGSINVHFSSTDGSTPIADETLCTLKVILAAGKTITNNGTIELAGQMSGGSGAANYAGFTAGEHARLVLDANAKVINNGTIYAAGMICEVVANNGSQVILNDGSTLYQPFTIRDFAGGSVTYAAYKTMSTSEPIGAFSRFILTNVYANVRVNYGGVVRVWAILWASDKNNQTVANFIGSSERASDAVIVLTDSTYSYLTCKFNVDETGREMYDLDIYGGAKANAMVLKIKVLTEMTISTEPTLFPISHHYDIEFHKSEGQEHAVFDMNYKYKLMTGAKLTVGEGVTLNLSEMIVYETFDDTRYDAGYMKYPEMPPAIFTVNGELVVNKLGGKVYSNNDGAKVTVNVAASYTAYELGVVSGSSIMASVDSKQVLTETMALVNADSSTVTELAPPVVYEYKNGQWSTVAVTIYSITTSESNATVTAPTAAQEGEVITVTVSFSGTKNYSLVVKDSAGNELLNKNAAGTYTFTMPASDVTISASSVKESSGCFTPDTLITLADGTQKRAEDVTLDDVLLVFNHETGEYEAAGIIFIENDGWKEYNVITLTFSDGTTTKLIYEHAYFDLTLGKYVYITEQNYADFIGHEFAKQSENGFERVTMTDATLAVEYTGCYSLVTVYHLNYFIDGLFSIPGGITGLFNMFEYGDDLVYDQEKMQADIEEYGLFTYEDFEEFLPYEFYQAFPAAYLKVSIGKGLMTFDDIYLYIEQFLVKNGLM